MTTLRPLLCGLALGIVLNLTAMPALAEEPSNEALALELMLLSGGEGVAEGTVMMLAQQMRPAYPLVPEDTWNEVFSAIDLNEVRGILAKVYTKHFTRDELTQLIAFYKSPVGKRLTEVLPLVMQDSMAAGQEWNIRMANQIMEALKARGHNPPTFEQAPATP